VFYAQLSRGVMRSLNDHGAPFFLLRCRETIFLRTAMPFASRCSKSGRSLIGAMTLPATSPSASPMLPANLATTASQSPQEPVHVAVPGVAGIIPNSHIHSNSLNLIKQFDQRQMRFQKIRFAA
jgi:hypothetical protein